MIGQEIHLELNNVGVSIANTLQEQGARIEGFQTVGTISKDIEKKGSKQSATQGGGKSTRGVLEIQGRRSAPASAERHAQTHRKRGRGQRQTAGVTGIAF